MKAELLYWVLMLFWLVFGIWSGWPAGAPNQMRNYRPLGGTLLLFILLVLLGWKGPFGAPLK